MVKAEEDSILSAPFSDSFSYNNNNNSLMLDMFYTSSNHQLLALEQEQQERSSSFGFMELLGFQNMSPLGVQNHPTTPNSTSYSSASSGAAAAPNNHQEPTAATADRHDIEEDQAEEDDEQQKLKKELKPKNVSSSQQKKKKEREARIAFMTRSEVDHLEDGYRWRKYGQKAVKNSPFPRGYYRCTNAKCNVKKRVERCFNDPTMVVTTYEGKHTHLSPSSPYPNSSVALSTTNYPGFFRAVATDNTTTFLPPTQSPVLQLQQVTDFNSGGYLDAAYDDMERCSQTPTYAAFLREHHGLLQDIVPSPPPGNNYFNNQQ